MMRFHQFLVFLVFSLLTSLTHALHYPGPDPNSLPLETLFPGPWESNIRAPFNKSYIQPLKIYNHEGAISNAASVLQDSDSTTPPLSISPGALVTFEFAENIGGKYVPRSVSEI